MNYGKERTTAGRSLEEGRRKNNNSEEVNGFNVSLWKGHWIKGVEMVMGVLLLSPAPRLAVSHQAGVFLHGRLLGGERGRPGGPLDSHSLRGRRGRPPPQGRSAVDAPVRTAAAVAASALLPPFHI
ncbi:hypothetical protein L7F22_012126 [Adiantum nelumboides]|nr:hypothetical protein [Adiantum nelumboides]